MATAGIEAVGVESGMQSEVLRIGKQSKREPAREQGERVAYW